MSQHDFVIDNGPGLAVRTDINAAVQALASQSSGPIEPSSPVAGMVWLDTSVAPNGLLRQRNLANTAWILPTLALGDVTADHLRLLAGSDVSETSTLHAFQIGASTGPNIRMDTNEILGVDNGVAAAFYLNSLQVTATGGLLLASDLVGAGNGAAFGLSGFTTNTVGVGVIVHTAGHIVAKKAGTATNTLAYFQNNSAVTPTLVGFISTTGSTTTYSTTSDEELKTFEGELTGEDAIAIIRADPARRFHWNADGTAAVGWGAQTSYEISPDLATPPPEPTEEDIAEWKDGIEPKAGEPGYHPWGMDMSKRTPYLWAALAAALDKIDALEARLAAVEAAGA